MSKVIYVAVYGTLRKGESNHYIIRDAKPFGVSRIKGFTMYSNGFYPYAVSRGKGITVELYKVDADHMRRLDSLEGYPYHYNRKKVTVKGKKAWVYFTAKKPDVDGITKVDSGDWMDAARRGNEVYAK